MGVYRQDGAWGLVFGIASTEREFQQPDMLDRLRELHARMETFRKAVGAQELRFAGILPSRFCAAGISTSKAEGLTTVDAILKAEVIVRSREQINESAPIIVLGANGLIGQLLNSRLAQRTVYPVDVGPSGKDFPNRACWPNLLTGQPAVLINVACEDTLALYLDLIWREVVILDDAYPSPGRAVLDKLRALNCSCYHLSGAVGTAYPDLPWPYAGVIPCCAAHVDDDTDLIVRRLV